MPVGMHGDGTMENELVRKIRELPEGKYVSDISDSADLWMVVPDQAMPGRTPEPVKNSERKVYDAPIDAFDIPYE